MVVKADAEPAESQLGMVKANVTHGAVVVQSSDGNTYRLSWGEDRGISEDGLRALPAGEYSIRGYRLTKKDKKGKPWHFSVSGAAIGKFTLEPGKVHELAIDDRVYLANTAARKKGKINACVGFRGANRAGATLYKGDERVMIQCSLKTVDGKKVDQAAAEFG